MYVWTVTVNAKDKEIKAFNPVEVSEPYVSAEYAMKDWFWKHLPWEHVKITKFGGAVLEHWEAEDEKYEYLLESQHVNGAD